MVESRRYVPVRRRNEKVKVIYCSTFTHVTEGDTMGRAEVLRTIKDSENEAERIRIDATAKASETISNARVTASETLSTGRQSADDEAASITNEARASSAKEATKVSAEGDSKLEKVAINGKKNRKSAAEVVLSAFRKA